MTEAVVRRARGPATVPVGDERMPPQLSSLNIISERPTISQPVPMP